VISRKRCQQLRLNGILSLSEEKAKLFWNYATPLFANVSTFNATGQWRAINLSRWATLRMPCVANGLLMEIEASPG